jgi:Flp pilus assembly protein TadG
MAATSRRPAPGRARQSPPEQTGGSLARPERRRSCLREEDGSTTVEFALTMVIVMSFILGIMEIGICLFTYNFVADAARLGTRYAMVRGSSCNATGSLCTTTTQTDVQSYLRGQSLPGITPASMTVTTTWPDTTGCAPSSSPCNNPGNHVIVAVKYQFPLSIPFVPASTVNLASTSEAVISN